MRHIDVRRASRFGAALACCGIDHRLVLSLGRHHLRILFVGDGPISASSLRIRTFRFPHCVHYDNETLSREMFCSSNERCIPAGMAVHFIPVGSLR